MRHFKDLSALAAQVGQEVAVTDWVTVTQQRINQFAEATGDHQWIHVDPDKARGGPFGSTIAHGFLTLALIPQFFQSVLQVGHIGMAVNYGLNRVRFTAPVPVEARLRARLKLARCEVLPQGAMQMAWDVTIEREHAERPVCLAESLVRYYP